MLVGRTVVRVKITGAAVLAALAALAWGTWYAGLAEAAMHALTA